VSVRIAGMGRVVFAALLIALGVQGLMRGDFTMVWQPVPEGLPGHAILAALCASLSLACGVGLLWRRTAGVAAGVLLAALVLWFLLFRVRALFIASLVEGTWSCGETLVMTAAAWVLFATFTRDRAGLRPRFVTGDSGMRIARVLYGVGLIPFGYAHFANLQFTASLVPGWLPWHVAWACFTGAAFIAAGVAVAVGVWGRPAAVLSTLQMGLFGLLVWVPVLAAGSATAFQREEFMGTLALTAAGWVVADSFWCYPPVHP